MCITHIHFCQDSLVTRTLAVVSNELLTYQFMLLNQNIITELLTDSKERNLVIKRVYCKQICAWTLALAGRNSHYDLRTIRFLHSVEHTESLW